MNIQINTMSCVSRCLEQCHHNYAQHQNVVCKRLLMDNVSRHSRLVRRRIPSNSIRNPKQLSAPLYITSISMKWRIHRYAELRANGWEFDDAVLGWHRIVNASWPWPCERTAVFLISFNGHRKSFGNNYKINNIRVRACRQTHTQMNKHTHAHRHEQWPKMRACLCFSVIDDSVGVFLVQHHQTIHIARLYSYGSITCTWKCVGLNVGSTGQTTTTAADKTN